MDHFRSTSIRICFFSTGAIQTLCFSCTLMIKASAPSSPWDENRIAEAFIHSDIEVEGDLLEVFRFRDALVDNHRLFYWWNVYGRRFLFGQVKSDRRWIAEHYNHGEEFYLNFLDRYRAYSQGIFEDKQEELDTAIQRKLDFACTSCNLKPGDSVLDIGGGWGAFLEFAGKKGINVTSITIAKDSQEFMGRLIAKYNLPGIVRNCHFFDFKPGRKFDAIVNLGVTEHLPNYRKTVAKYLELLKPGGRIYIDASAANVKYRFSTYINKYIYPGNPSPLYLPGYIKTLSKSKLELTSLYNDRVNYYLTALRWCQNLEKNAVLLKSKYGELYRIFQLYLYGTAHAFDSGLMSAYRLVLTLPDLSHGHSARQTRNTQMGQLETSKSI